MKPDTSYRAGTLRRPTNIDGMYPQPTQPLRKAPDYLDELGRQLGRAIGLALLMAVAAWLMGVFK